MNSFEETTNANHLWHSAQKVRKSSPGKYQTHKFMREILINIDRAINELKTRSWVIEQMKPFIIYERGHPRKIIGNTPYDRMILHCYLDYYLEPMLSKYLIYDNYASQVEKGVDLARRRFKEQLSRAYREYGNNQFYVMLMDFRKFYDNVQHQKLYDSIMEKIPYTSFDEYMIWTILDSFKVDVSWMSTEEYLTCMDNVYIALDHLYEEPKGEKFMSKSLNIGNQASQLFSIFYPTRIDNYVKIVKGFKKYGRYMDDMSFIHNDKKYLWNMLDELRPICDDMGLFINEKKTQLYRVDNDFKYLNRIYRVTESGHICERLAPATIIREQQKIRKYKGIGKSIEEQFKSWSGSFYKYMTIWEIENMEELLETC